MAVDRREFLRISGALAAKAATGPLTGISTLVDAVTSSTGSAQSTAIVALLKRRSQLMVTSGDDMDMQGLQMHFAERHAALQNEFLGPVDWDPALLTDAEKLAFRQGLSSLKADYQTHLGPIQSEIAKIDATLAKYPDGVRKVLAPRERYDQMVEGICRGPEHVKASRIAQLGEQPLADIDVGVVEDAQAILSGGRRDLLSMQTDQAAEVIADVDRAATQVARVSAASRPKNWKEKRQEALMNSVNDALYDIAQSPHARIESTLTKGYGPDNWSISTRFGAGGIDGPEDFELGNHFNDLENALKKAYPERFTPDADPLLTRGRPLQAGYGEHDCERMSIEGPPFALREILKEAETTNLKMHNASSKSERGASK